MSSCVIHRARSPLQFETVPCTQERYSLSDILSCILRYIPLGKTPTTCYLHYLQARHLILLPLCCSHFVSICMYPHWLWSAGSGSTGAKMTHKIRKNFIFWSVGCSLLRAEGFACSLNFLHGRKGIKKRIFFHLVQLKMLDLYPY